MSKFLTMKDLVDRIETERPDILEAMRVSDTEHKLAIHNNLKGVRKMSVKVPTALLILCYPAKGFLSPDRHKTERKLLEDTVMYENYSEDRTLT